MDVYLLILKATKTHSLPPERLHERRHAGDIIDIFDKPFPDPIPDNAFYYIGITGLPDNWTLEKIKNRLLEHEYEYADGRAFDPDNPTDIAASETEHVRQKRQRDWRILLSDVPAEIRADIIANNGRQFTFDQVKAYVKSVKLNRSVETGDF